MTDSDNKRQQKHRDKMRKAGYVLVQYWIPADKREALKKFIARLNK